MIMKKTGIAVLMLIFLSMNFVMAQRGTKMSPEQMAKKQTEHMQAELNLTAEQVPQVEAINLKYIELMRDAKKSGLERQDMMFKMKELSDDKKKEMKAVLTKEQFKKYKKYVNRQMQMRQNGAMKGRQRGNNGFY